MTTKTMNQRLKEASSELRDLQNELVMLTNQFEEKKKPLVEKINLARAKVEAFISTMED